MNWDQIKSNWKHVSDRIKVAWAKLNRCDSAATVGKSKLVPLPIRIEEKQ